MTAPASLLRVGAGAESDRDIVAFTQRLASIAAPVFALLWIGLDDYAFGFLAAMAALASSICFLQLRLDRPRADILMATIASLSTAQIFTLDPGILAPLLVVVAALAGVGSVFTRQGRTWVYHSYLAALLLAQLFFVEAISQHLLTTVFQLVVYLIVGQTLRTTVRSLARTRGKFDSLFDRVPTAIWVEDFRRVAQWLDDLRSKGVTDLDAHLAANPELVQEAFCLISVMDVNPAAVDLVEADEPEQLIGKLQPEMYRSETRDAVIAQLKAVWSGDSVMETDVAGITLTGKEIDCVLQWTAPRTASGLDLSRVIVSLVNVSELKASEREARMELKLARNQRRLEIIAASSVDLLYTLDEEGSFSWVSDSVTPLLGYTPQELLGLHHLEFVHPDERSQILTSASSIGPGEVGDPIQHQVRHALGSWRVYEATTRNMTDDPLVGGWVVSSRDITERVAAEQRLRDSETRFRLLAENSTDMITSHDPTGEYRYVSPSCETLLGCPPEAMVGTTPYDISHPEDREAITAAHRQVLNETGTVTVEYRLRHADASWRWMESTIKPIRDETGENIVRIHASTRDVTARHEADERLRLAKDAAEAATEAKSQFLANISHEIRTPMNAILGMTELTLGTDINAEQREYLGTVKSSVDALITLVNDLLDIAKIEAGRLELEEIPFSLSDTIGDTLRTMASRAAEKGLELSQDIEDDVPDAVVGDPGRIRQILFNLVGNAIKFTHVGSVNVAVSKTDDRTGSVGLHFAVTDTGIGIPEDKLAAIFEAFTQADGSTTRRFGGTGLGLSISAQLTEMMKGEIWVESAMGAGSTFHFTIRVQPAEAGSVSRMMGLTPLASVLVLADSEDSRRSTAEMIHRAGAVPIVVPDLAAAFDSMFATDGGDAPTSIVIAVRSGTLDLARRIITDPTFENLPVVVVVPSGKRGDATIYRDAGVAGYLAKPVNPGDLSEMIAVVSGPDRPDGELVTRHWLRARRPVLDVLVADDSPTNRMLAIRLLEKRGHRVTAVDDGRQAFEAVKTGSFQAVLMDVQMPEMDGLEATAAIRGQETDQRIPIIGLTAHASEADRQRCLDAGMDAWVSKPFQPEELFATLEQLGSGSVELPHDEPEDSVEAIDRFEALELLGGATDLAVEVMQVFREEYPQVMNQISVGFRESDLDLVARAAHTLKGNLGLLAAHPAAQAAALLERHAAAGQQAHALKASEVLEAEIGRLEPLVEVLSSSASAWH